MRHNMSTNDERNKLKKLFESVSIKFDEAMDYISNIEIKNNEYKQILSSITTNIKDLNQKLLDLASFSPPLIEDKGEEPSQEMADVMDALDAMILEKPEKMKPSSALSSDQKKSAMKMMEKEKIMQAPISSPKPITTPESDFGLTPVPKLEKSAEKPADLTPVPKFNGKIKTSSKPQQEVSAQEIPTEEMTPFSKIADKTKPESLEPITTEIQIKPEIKEDLFQKIEPEKKTEETIEEIPEKKVILRNTDDVFNNLMIDIDLSESFRQLGSTIRLATDFLKQFVKFHKVLFDMLKVASDTNREKGRLTKEYKNKIKQKISEWKREVYFI